MGGCCNRVQRPEIFLAGISIRDMHAVEVIVFDDLMPTR